MKTAALRLPTGFRTAIKLVFSVEPSSYFPSTSISPSIVVLVKDKYNNTVQSSTDTVTLTISTNPGSSTLGGTTAKASVAGVAIFDDITLNNAASGYALTASVTGLTDATSSTFDITNATAGAWVFDSGSSLNSGPNAPSGYSSYFNFPTAAAMALILANGNNTYENIVKTDTGTPINSVKYTGDIYISGSPSGSTFIVAYAPV